MDNRISLYIVVKKNVWFVGVCFSLRSKPSLYLKHDRIPAENVFVQFTNNMKKKKWIILKWIYFFFSKSHMLCAYVCNSLTFKVRITCSCWIWPTKLLYRHTPGLTALWQTCCEFSTVKINSLGKYHKKKLHLCFTGL